MMQTKTKIARFVALLGYFGLLFFLVAWYAWLMPSKYFPVSLTLIVMVSPLLFALKGIIAGKPYTHAWTSYLALFYFAHGSSQAWVMEDDRIYASIEAGLSVVLFWGVVMFARYRSRELKSLETETE